MLLNTICTLLDHLCTSPYVEQNHTKCIYFNRKSLNHATSLSSPIIPSYVSFKGFGDSKIVPNLPVEQFEAIVKASAAFASDKASVEAIWASVKAPMYTLTDRQKQLGLGCKGVSTYFSDNCDQDDSDKINR